jgi:uncharacterized glyoxalase superfamily protein PhnB
MTAQHEFYPMPSFPLLAVANLAKSSLWYQDVLGFAHVFTMPGPGGNPALVHLRWLKYADLLLRAGPSIESMKGIGITLNFAMMDRSLDALAARARESGAHFIQEPGDRPWNARDFTLTDPDGFALTFTRGALNRDLTLDAVTANSSRS